MGVGALTHHIILGFDFGLKRIGVAVGQSITQSANPIKVLSAKNGVPNWVEIKKIIAEWGVDTLVVGLPLNMDATEQPITQRARDFGAQLEAQFHLPVFFVDERLTTVAARDEMHTKLKGTARFDHADSMSAKLIVESYFNS